MAASKQNFDSTFRCSECDKTFSTQGNLSKHNKRFHNIYKDEKLKLSGKHTCDKYEKTFTLKSSLDRHWKELHQVDEEAAKICPYCKISFTRTSNLSRHIDSNHKDKKESSVCNTKYSDPKTLLMHEQQEHNNEKKQSTNQHQCDVCDKKFSSKSNLNRHLERAHNLDLRKSPTVICPLCDTAFQTILIMEKHLIEKHDQDLIEEKLEFSSIDDFKKWKKAIEKEDTAFFYLKCGARQTNKYYECHRSGPILQVDSDKKVHWTNSNKIGKNCPARIYTTTDDNGHIHARFQRKHIGHTQSIKFLNLSKEERDELAGKISMGITFNRILDDIRTEVEKGATIGRLQLLEKRDLHNIVRDYNLDTDVVHKDDAFSVDMWVQQQRLLGESSPVLYFKMQGVNDDGPLLKEDFMIVLMTPYQRDFVVEYSSDKVLLDSTHKTTGHDFQLTTLLTVDNYGAGCPVSFCLSNRIDAVAMTKFFQSVKNKVGPIEANIIMTDDTPAFVNAWTAVMPSPKHHLLCNWHVDKNWRNNLEKVNGNVKQSEVYKTCRMLMECLNEDEFHNLLDAFLVWCEADSDTKKFGRYFEKFYAGRPEKWAFCFRKGLSLNTNMYLEAMHKKIKYFYMDGKENRRVDKCIALLMRFSRDMMFDSIIRMAKNKPTHRMQKIAESHRQSNNIPDDMIKKVDVEKWIVRSSSAGREPYIVSKNLSKDCVECPLSCPKCRICVHQYACTCVDHLIKGNLCKHVHACMRISKSDICIIDEERSTASFENVCQKVFSASQDQHVHIRDSVSQVTRYETLLNIAFSLVRNATDEALANTMPRLESIVNELRNNQKDEKTSADSTPQFSKLPSNLPSQKNIQKQRFFSTKKQRVVSEHKLAKPTDFQKVELKSALNDINKSSEFINTDFDHSYGPSSSKKISKN